VAKTIQLFGLLDPKRALQAGKEAGFVKDTQEAREKKNVKPQTPRGFQASPCLTLQ
jgi:hypothetical protein